MPTYFELLPIVSDAFKNDLSFDPCTDNTRLDKSPNPVPSPENYIPQPDRDHR